MRGIRAVLISFVALGVLLPATAGHEPAAAWDGTFSVRGSVAQYAVTHAVAGATLELWDAREQVVDTGVVDAQGSYLFREVAPDAGYRVVQNDAGVRTIGPPATVLDRDTDPPQSFYDAQVLAPGFGYITTRDGTTLSATITLPGPADGGPYPTVIEYSGYSPSNPRAPQPSTLIAQALGFATVGVNIRGTGCSGGAFLYFEPLQALDGYDIVEAVAAQPWVLHGEPGMVGISYPGIAQLFTAREQPPHLAAIAPLAVIGDTYRSTLYPGGIFNDGFALDWAKGRVSDSRPYGQGWERGIVDAGGPNGAQCAENQLLRLQNPDLLQLIQDTAFYVDELNDEVSPERFVDRIEVPVFVGAAFQDEQVSGHSANLFDDFTSSPSRHFMITNGAHVDPLVAELGRWYEFLEFYVTRRTPDFPDALAPLVGPVVGSTVGINGVEIEPDRFVGMSYATALAQYEAEGDLRVIFENGYGNPAIPGSPQGTFEHTFSQWPPAETVPTTWYLQPDGALAPTAPAIDALDHRGSSAYQYDPTAKIEKTIAGGTGDAWPNDPDYDWRALPDGKALAFESPALTDDVVMVGTGRFDLWLRSTAPDTDVEVTLTEIRPDGQERYVQNGWLRASHRRLDDARSTVLRPFQTHHEADALALEPTTFAELDIEIFPFAHVFRAGSRLRISVEAPGGNRPAWTLDAIPASGVVTNEVGHSAAFASKITLPVIPGLDPPAALPPCPSLRGQPCRAYVAPAAPTAVTAAVVDADSLRVRWTAPNRAGVVDYLVTDLVTGATRTTTATEAVFDDVGVGAHAYSVVARSGETTSGPSTPSSTLQVVPAAATTSTSVAASTTTTAPSSTTVAGAGATTTAAPNASTTSAGASGGTLPYTGFALGGLALAGVGAFVAGTALRRRSRPQI